MLHDTDVPDAVNGSVLERQGEDIAANAHVHNRMAALQHRLNQIERGQHALAAALVDQHRRFRGSRSRFDQESSRAEIAVHEMGYSAREYDFSIHAKEAL